MQRQAAAMDPAQMQQAMNMLHNMTPEQRRSVHDAAANLPPEKLVQQASTAQQNLSSHQKYQYDASVQLKAEGNKLHSLKKFKEAAEKYQQAIQNLAAHASEQSIDLRVSCQSNLASCHLQQGSYQECVSACDVVLSENPANRKALYRRGQALAELGSVEDAIRDLQKALELSPEAEKPHIESKLKEVKQRREASSQGIALEESTNESIDNGTTKGGTGVETVAKEEEGTVEDVTVQEEARSLNKEGPSTELQQPTPIAQPPPEQIQRAAEIMRQDPDMVRRTADIVAGMSDAELAAHLSQAGGIPAVTPEMARAAASMMKTMPPEQIQDMAEKAAVSMGGGMAANVGLAGTPQVPAVPSAEAAAEMLKRNPDGLKTAAKMIQTLPAEQLQAMAAAMPAMPGAPSGLNLAFDPEQLRAAAKMMENMSVEEFERMTKLAQSMAMPAMPVGVEDRALGPPPVASSPDATSVAAVESIPSASVPGAAPRFDPGSMTPEALNAMRRQMANPDLLRSMQSMLKGMDPESLASMMRATGMNMTADQAQRMVDSMANVSDRQLEWLAWMGAVFNQIIDTYQKARAWVRSNMAVALAILALVLYLLLRWLKWM